MNVTYYGHSCFSVEIAGSSLLFDPFISPNDAASHIDIKSLDPDFVLITHGHEDHMADAEQILKQSNATLITNFEIANWFQDKGFEKVQPLNHGGTVNLPVCSVKYVAAIHSSVLPDGTYGGNPGGFVVESADGSFYNSGDTALTHDMKMLGDHHTLDWAALCIGDCFTMGFKDASICAEWAGVTKVLGLHYDTFPPIEIDQDAARSHFEAKHIILHLPAIGEAIDL